MSKKSADANPNRRLLGCKCKLCRRRNGVTEPGFRARRADLKHPLRLAEETQDEAFREARPVQAVTDDETEEPRPVGEVVQPAGTPGSALP